MELSALFKLSYGLFIAGVEYEGKRNACVINTAAQATVEPVKMIVTMLKSDYTTSLIEKKGSMTISVMSLNTPLTLIGDYGTRSGRDCEKFESYPYETDANGNPYLKDTMTACMSLRVDQTIDLGTHDLFICTVEDARNLSDESPMTYADYRVIKNGGKVMSEEKKEKKYVCTVCHYEYDGDVPFEELPDDYVCPICGVGKELFEEA